MTNTTTKDEYNTGCESIRQFRESVARYHDENWHSIKIEWVEMSITQDMKALDDSQGRWQDTMMKTGIQ